MCQPNADLIVGGVEGGREGGSASDGLASTRVLCLMTSANDRDERYLDTRRGACRGGSLFGEIGMESNVLNCSPGRFRGN